MASSVLLPPVAQVVSPVFCRFAACVWHGHGMVYVYTSHVNRSRRVALQNWVCVLSARGSLLLCLSVCLSVCLPVRLSVSASVSRSSPNTCSLFTDPSCSFPSPTSIPLTRLCIVSLNRVTRAKGDLIESTVMSHLTRTRRHSCECRVRVRWGRCWRL